MWSFPFNSVYACVCVCVCLWVCGCVGVSVCVYDARVLKMRMVQKGVTVLLNLLILAVDKRSILRNLVPDVLASTVEIICSGGVSSAFCRPLTVVASFWPTDICIPTRFRSSLFNRCACSITLLFARPCCSAPVANLEDTKPHSVPMFLLYGWC